MTSLTQKTSATFWASFASFMLGVGVLLGAFGAHGLQAHPLAHPKTLALWQTATLYLFVHALGILIIAILIHLKWCKQALAILMSFGIFLFSGSLYLLALGAPSRLGIITPIGGLCFVVAWFLLAWQSIKAHKTRI